MREMKIAIAALYRPEEYILHRRNGNKARGAVGLIGFFGGEREAGETFRRTAAREVGEETSLELSPEAFEPLSGMYKVISDRDNQPITIWAKVFQVLLPYGTVVKVKDPENDEVVAVSTPDIIQSHLGKGSLTPATERAFKDYIFKDFL